MSDCTVGSGTKLHDPGEDRDTVTSYLQFLAQKRVRAIVVWRRESEE